MPAQHSPAIKTMPAARYSENAFDFMSHRSLNSHGQFFVPYLTPGLSVLDCGCGPGSLTLGLASRVLPGKVVGIDQDESEIRRALAVAARWRCRNLSFQVADCYSLPFGANRFDRVFSHALLEHLSDPVAALKEMHRVLKPGGLAGVCSPDWGGFIISPPSEDISSALATYIRLQRKNGGNTQGGRNLGQHSAAAGFELWRCPLGMSAIRHSS